MFHFDWTITLGSVIGATWGIGFGCYRLIVNHLSHVKDEVNARFDKVDRDIRELRQIVFRRKSL